jgi:hypothetical protein
MMTARELYENLVKQEQYASKYAETNKKINANMGIVSYNRVNQNKLDRSLEIKKVVFNPPATIILWADHTKTVVKCQEGDEFDPEKGMTMAFMKKARGNTGGYFKEIDKWAGEYTRKQEELNNKYNSFFDVELAKRQLENLKSALGVKLDDYVGKPTLKNMAAQFIDEKSESDE